MMRASSVAPKIKGSVECSEFDDPVEMTLSNADEEKIRRGGVRTASEIGLLSNARVLRCL